MSDRALETSSAQVPAPSLRGWLYARFLRSEALRGYALLSPTLVLMLCAMCIPFGIMVVISFWIQTGFEFTQGVHFDNYAEFFDRPAYGVLLARSLTISAACTLGTVLLSYPMAYYVAFHVHKNKMAWIILMTLPFWTSYLLRIFAWKIVLGFNGVINSGLIALGIVDQPLEFLLYSPSAVVVTLTHAWAAFAILPIYVSLEKIDRSLLEAATDLGDGPVKRFFGITLPLSLPGVIAATLMIFIPTVGDFVTPALVGGPDGLMIANIIQVQFGKVNNWPRGAALALTMMITITTVSLVYIWATRRLTGRTS